MLHCRVAKFACPRVHDDQKMSEDNQKWWSGCPPDYQIFLGKYFENSCLYKFFEVSILTLSFSYKHISFWELKINRISHGIKMTATKNMSRTTRIPILVVLQLPTFDSNLATLHWLYNLVFYILWKSQSNCWNDYSKRTLLRTWWDCSDDSVVSEACYKYLFHITVKENVFLMELIVSEFVISSFPTRVQKRANDH